MSDLRVKFIGLDRTDDGTVALAADRLVQFKSIYGNRLKIETTVWLVPHDTFRGLSEATIAKLKSVGIDVYDMSRPSNSVQSDL